MQAWTLALFRSRPLEHLRRFALDNPQSLIRDLLSTLLLTMASYSYFVYPNLPAMFGGGYMPTARFVMKNQFNLAALLPELARVGDILGPLQIISESDDSIFVLPAKLTDQHLLVRLRRDQIDAILYEAKK